MESRPPSSPRPCLRASAAWTPACTIGLLMWRMVYRRWPARLRTTWPKRS